MGQRQENGDLRLVMDSFRRVVRALRKSSRDSEDFFGLRTAQFFVLQQVKEYGPLGINDLAEKTFSHQSTVSVVVEELVQRGYVECTLSTIDRRRVEVRGTAVGRSLIKKRKRTIQEKMAAGFMKMSSRQRHELARLLGKFISSSGLDSETPDFFFEKESPPARKIRRS